MVQLISFYIFTFLFSFGASLLERFFFFFSYVNFWLYLIWGCCQHKSSPLGSCLFFREVVATFAKGIMSRGKLPGLNGLRATFALRTQAQRLDFLAQHLLPSQVILNGQDWWGSWVVWTFPFLSFILFSVEIFIFKIRYLYTYLWYTHGHIQYKQQVILTSISVQKISSFFPTFIASAPHKRTLSSPESKCATARGNHQQWRHCKVRWRTCNGPFYLRLEGVPSHSMGPSYPHHPLP